MISEYLIFSLSTIFDLVKNIAWEYVLIVFLAVIVFVVILLFISKKEKYRGEMQRQKEKYDTLLLNRQKEFDYNLSTKKNEHEIQLHNNEETYKKKLDQKEKYYEDRLSNYAQQVKENFEKTIPLREIEILKTMVKWFDDPLFRDFTIYHQLEYDIKTFRKRVDFFVVSPKGLFVIESKDWKGTTYIYQKCSHDLFDNTTFDDFGQGGEIKIRVFNAKRDENNSKQIILSSYRNPVTQARDYSRDLRELLNSEESGLNISYVRNVAAFHIDNDYKVMMDDLVLPLHKEIDKISYVANDMHIKEFFKSYSGDKIDVDNINRALNTLFEKHKLHCTLKLSIHNYKEAPFNLL